MLRSMTGFASGSGSLAPHCWTWELRSVNGKGQDFRLRVPDWIDGLEVALRKKLSAGIMRGNVNLVLKITRDDTIQPLQLNTDQLTVVLSALTDIEASAADRGLALAPTTAAEIASMRGVFDAAVEMDDTTPLSAQLLAEADDLIAAFNAMRSSEGAALEAIVTGQLTEIGTLVDEAETLAAARNEEARATLKRNLSRVMENVDGLDEDRILQELALIAVKADVTEEIDRLRAHLAAASDLLGAQESVGRQLVFLTQEFVREANTLCAKSQNAELTRCGLALKAVIDQMREQIQNVE